MLCQDQCAECPHDQFHSSGYRRDERFPQTLQGESVDEEQREDQIAASGDGQVGVGQADYFGFLAADEESGQLAPDQDVHCSEYNTDTARKEDTLGDSFADTVNSARSVILSRVCSHCRAERIHRHCSYGLDLLCGSIRGN